MTQIFAHTLDFKTRDFIISIYIISIFCIFSSLFVFYVDQNFCPQNFCPHWLYFLAMPLNTTQYTCLMGLKLDPLLAETCLELLKLEA